MVSGVPCQSSPGTASTAYFSGRWDFGSGAVFFCSKISVGDGAVLPLCCPFLENPTILKALEFSRIFSGFHQQPAFLKKLTMNNFHLSVFLAYALLKREQL